MYTIYVSTLLALIFLSVLVIRKDSNLEDYQVVFGLSFTVFIVSILLVCIISLFITPKYTINMTRVAIMNMQDNGATSGRFFLGSGSIDGTMKYCFYERNEDSSYSLNMVNYTDAKIKYTNNTPLVEITTETPIGSKWYFSCESPKVNYVFKIPEGSIDNNFKLDAK